MNTKLILRNSIFFGMLISFLLLNQNCKKQKNEPSQIANDFFQTPKNSSNNLKLVINELRSLNDQKEFVTSINKKYGFPSWENIISNELLFPNADSLLYIVPIINDNQKATTAYISCVKVENKINFTFVSKQSVENSISINEITQNQIKSALVTIALFDKKIYNSLSAFKGFYNETYREANLTFEKRNITTGKGLDDEYVFWIKYCRASTETENTTKAVVIIPTCWTLYFNSSGVSTVLPPPVGGNTVSFGDNTNWYIESSGGNVSGNQNTLNPTILSSLTNTLSTNETESLWLLQNPTFAIQINNYLNSFAPLPTDYIEYAKKHLEYLMVDNNYLAYVSNQISTSTSGQIWWEDENWMNTNDDAITNSGLCYLDSESGVGGITEKTKEHVLKGEIRAGIPQGCHSYNAITSGIARWKPGTTPIAGPGGCQRGYIQLKIGTTNAYTTKSKFSTFFPSSWSDSKIIQEMTTAFNSKYFVNANPNMTPPEAHWEGLASNGMKIMFILKDINNGNSEVITAYPIY